MNYQNVIASVCLSLVVFACKNPGSESAVKDAGVSQSGFDSNGAAQSCVPDSTPAKPCATDTPEQQSQTFAFSASCTDGGFSVIRCVAPADSKCGPTLCSGNPKSIPRQTGYDINGKQQSCVPYSGRPLLCSPVTEEYIKNLAAFKAACTAGGFQVIGCVDAPDGRCGGVACTGVPKPAK